MLFRSGSLLPVGVPEATLNNYCVGMPCAGIVLLLRDSNLKRERAASATTANEHSTTVQLLNVPVGAASHLGQRNGEVREHRKPEAAASMTGLNWYALEIGHL